jgi:hypothetical protein
MHLLHSTAVEAFYEVDSGLKKLAGGQNAVIDNMRGALNHRGYALESGSWMPTPSGPCFAFLVTGLHPDKL